MTFKRLSLGAEEQDGRATFLPFDGSRCLLCGGDVCVCVCVVHCCTLNTAITELPLLLQAPASSRAMLQLSNEASAFCR